MNDPKELSYPERKRQLAAMDRQVRNHPTTLPPGLVEQYQAAHGNSAKKFALMLRPEFGIQRCIFSSTPHACFLGTSLLLRKQFMLDPTFQSVTVDAQFVDQHEQDQNIEGLSISRIPHYVIPQPSSKPISFHQFFPTRAAFLLTDQEQEGIWEELPLCDLEKIYHSEEDSLWLKDCIVSRPRLGVRPVGSSAQHQIHTEFCLRVRVRSRGETTPPGL